MQFALNNSQSFESAEYHGSTAGWDDKHADHLNFFVKTMGEIIEDDSISIRKYTLTVQELI